jgi:hypothetical protein
VIDEAPGADRAPAQVGQQPTDLGGLAELDLAGAEEFSHGLRHHEARGRRTDRLLHLDTETDSPAEHLYRSADRTRAGTIHDYAASPEACCGRRPSASSRSAPSRPAVDSPLNVSGGGYGA